LTYKSDDIQGRSAAFDSIVKGQSIRQVGTPASFNVLMANMRGLALDAELHSEDESEDVNNKDNE
jgi:DNA-directed RNA polymerase subunit beta